MFSQTKTQNLDGKLDWKLRKEIQDNKQKKKKERGKNAEQCCEKKRKATQVKQTIRLEEIDLKVLTNKGRLKRYRDKIKQYRQNRIFQNNERKFYQQVRGECTKTYQQPDDKEIKQFWGQIWKLREHNRNAK